MSGWHLNEDSFKRNHKVFSLERNKLQLEFKHNNDSILSIEMRTCDTGTLSVFLIIGGFILGEPPVDTLINLLTGINECQSLHFELDLWLYVLYINPYNCYSYASHRKQCIVL